MKNIKTFKARYDRQKRGIDLPRYEDGVKTVIADDGSVFNVNSSAIGVHNLEVTTPEVEVVGKKQYPYQSAFNPYALTEGIQYALGNTVGKVIEPISNLHEGVPNNGVYKLVDLSPQNIGYLNKKVRLIDVPAYKLSNGE